eukprot:Phypoly_transcript_05363.p1 GENE.Phypoly_transcript_05363~~Phypoly_transcript_05363.p1  ORF type:complete len:615 (+),score=107.27 Phypoly_transcript_05363:79-1923(+)
MNNHGFGSPPSQRRLRHLKCIMIRSLVPANNSPSLGAFYYTLHVHRIEIEAGFAFRDGNEQSEPGSPQHALDIDRINPSLTSSTDQTPKMNGTTSKPHNPSYPTVNTSSSSASPRFSTTLYPPDSSPTDQNDNDNNNNNNNVDNSSNDTNNKETNNNETNRSNDGEPVTNETEKDKKTGRPRASTADLYRGVVPQPVEADDELPQPFYTSEVVTNTCNPTWRHLDCSRFHLLDFVDVVHSFNICVWSCQPSTDDTTFAPVLQCEIDLTELEFIGSELRQIGYYAFPPNSLLFEMKDGLYVTKDTRDNMRPSRVADVKPPIAPDKRKATTCNQFAFVALIAKRRGLMRAQEMSNHFSEAIEQKLGDHATYIDLVKQRDALRMRIAQLKEESTNAKATLKTDEDVLKATRSELLPRSRTLARAQVALLGAKQQLSNQEARALEKEKDILRALKESYEFRRWYLVSQIRTIYTIQQSQDGKSLSVNGFKLPNSDFTGCDEEQIATALGYVSHILYLAAKYLEVPLRYPMIPMCSRSMILDEISQQTSPKFPLYSRGVDRTRFEYAVFLLNKNLEQLLNSQGLEIISLRHTLPNVQILLSKERTSTPSNNPNNNNNNT